MDKLTAMNVFKRVVDLGSFSAAARDLGFSNAAVSKNVSELEAYLGVRLLTRTTRRLSVTEAGQTYHNRCVAVLEEIDEAEQEAGQLSSKPRGVLKINAPMSFGLMHLSSAIPAFLQRYPDIAVDLVMNDRFVDLVEEGFDVALRVGGPLADSSLISRRITAIQRVVCGAPGYFDRYGAPETPEDLKDHQCLIYSLSSSPREWRFTGPAGERVIKVMGRFTANSSISLREALVAGLGLTLIPTFVVGKDLRDGRLNTVLEEWTPQPQAAYAVYVHRQYVPAKVRCFVDFLVEQFRPEPNWDR